MATHNDIGKKGEELAMEYLIKNRYNILERNYFAQKAEIDIIAQKENILAIIEVKTRTSTDFGLPQDFVNQKKIQLLLKAVNHYIDTNDLDLEVRFDIIAIHLRDNTEVKLEHLTDAFYFF